MADTGVASDGKAPFCPEPANDVTEGPDNGVAAAVAAGDRLGPLGNNAFGAVCPTVNGTEFEAAGVSVSGADFWAAGVLPESGTFVEPGAFAEPLGGFGIQRVVHLLLVFRRH